ncbi:MBL fold metallo-hydrolase RNA specificity domain-containing protein [Aliidiomarina indica]|uniref:MBL fold metallo-hydrolase RNA specificity domain-containing protein n=1 Tax=Aliidiomarina indica TaxID=2749147 RepID=UPI00189002E0|nr:MBL fold metallo-hydrolase [Aliidiomarina indica]
MRVVFLGGTETVTGSKYLVETETTRILVDCGLFQGYKWLRKRNWQPLPLAIDEVDGIVLTHAHLDHSGYVPVLYKHGYRKPVYTHSATAELCRILWPDSGKIQEEDAKYLERHNLSKHEKPEPLYTANMAVNACKLLHPVEFQQRFSIGDITVTLSPVGHILGAASVVVEADGKRVGFSGDVGRTNDLLMKPPKPMPHVDVLMLESTYGDRRHEETDLEAELAKVINDTAKAGGVLLIPSFAVGRAQLLQHMIVALMDEQRVPRMPVYLDSPMAISVSGIYRTHHEHHRLNETQCQRIEQAVKYTHSVDESKAIANQQGPHIIIAGSGMATGGRILHHFKNWLGDHRCTVLFAGYQAGGTRGAKMLQGVEHIKLHGEWVPIRAQIRNLEGMSGHADYVELKEWLEASKMPASTKIQLVHGEPEALEKFRDYLSEFSPYEVDIPDYMSILRL